jgi:hypothetical protein
MWLTRFHGAIALADDHARRTKHTIVLTSGPDGGLYQGPSGPFDGLSCLECGAAEGGRWCVSSYHLEKDPDERVRTFAGRETLASFLGILVGPEASKAFARSLIPSRYVRNPVD